MKRTHATTIAVTALAVWSVATVALYFGGAARAGDTNAPPPEAILISFSDGAPVNQDFKLELDGVTVRAQAPQQTLKAGDMPTFQITACNSGEQQQDVELTLELKASQITSPFSRMMPMPEQFFTGEIHMTSLPGADGTAEFTVTKPLEAGKEYMLFALRSDPYSSGLLAVMSIPDENAEQTIALAQTQEEAVQ
ncbi:hypothetical protein JXA32_01890 [Candidatus Sumerlaeota bacterium]|nr:hypothetical protein [Candidatus Sumerlaeota bacterium]